MTWNGTPLDRLPIKVGHWRFTARFEQVRAAIRCGLTPTQFDALEAEDKAYILAHWRTLDAMGAWEQQEAEKEAKRAEHGNRANRA